MVAVHLHIRAQFACHLLFVCCIQCVVAIIIIIIIDVVLHYVRIDIVVVKLDKLELELELPFNIYLYHILLLYYSPVYLAFDFCHIVIFGFLEILRIK